MPGIVAAKIGAQQVLLCDNPKVDPWLPLIRDTLAVNSLIADRIRIEYLDWYDGNSIDALIKTGSTVHIDFILGSDIFFHKKGKSNGSDSLSKEMINLSFQILKLFSLYWIDYSDLDNHL